MNEKTLEFERLQGVIAVPPLARRPEAGRPLDLDENTKLVRHMAEGGITRFVYGGNALLHHLTLGEYEVLLEWLAGLEGDHLVIPSAGPDFGHSLDQAALLRRHRFPLVMMLPSGAPRTAAGLEQGLREFADAAATPLLLYLKEEKNFGADPEAGLDVVARLVDDGLCRAIKYAVVREDPRKDPYLEGLLARVDRRLVVSGIGERPAVVHLRDWNLPGFTTGSGCIAPRLSNLLFEACAKGEFERADSLRTEFIPLEDLRDRWGPPRVLHFATELAGVACTGPIVPYLSPLAAEQQEEVGRAARALHERNESRVEA